MTAVRVDPEAERELREAARWYRERSKDVARRFLREVRDLSRLVSRWPLRFPVVLDLPIAIPVRRALVSSFPYAIVFVLTDSSVRVIAIAHQHRMPGYWLHRVQPAAP